MTELSRLDRYQRRTEWPLAAEEDTANQAATRAQIEELREEIRRLNRPGDGRA